VELFTPGGFYLLFFGVGAILTGALASTGLVGNLAAQVIFFVVASLGGALSLRRSLVARFSNVPAHHEVDSLVGGIAVALQDLPPGGSGKVELRGASWDARNSGGIPLVRGQRCTVERVEGLTLWVRIAADEFLQATRPAETQVS
jgi:inner membrane protein